MPTLAEIHVYPVKSCRGIALESALVTPSGIEWDRRWMFVDAGGTFLSQRTHPQLARIETALTAEGLVLRAPRMEALVLPFEERGEPLPVRVWKDACVALDQGPESARWAREAVGANVRIVRAAHDTGRRAHPDFAGTIDAPVTFADAFPLLVCNRASLDEVNARMPQPVPMNRFRPNIVIDGLEAFAEDHIDAIDIGALRLKLVKPCTRCVTTSTDQSTGVRGANPLPVLRKFRFDTELLGVTFGENAVVELGAGTVVRRGTACTV